MSTAILVSFLVFVPTGEHLAGPFYGRTGSVECLTIKMEVYRKLKRYRPGFLMQTFSCVVSGPAA